MFATFLPAIRSYNVGVPRGSHPQATMTLLELLCRSGEKSSTSRRRKSASKLHCKPSGNPNSETTTDTGTNSTSSSHRSSKMEGGVPQVRSHAPAIMLTSVTSNSASPYIRCRNVVEGQVPSRRKASTHGKEFECSFFGYEYNSSIIQWPSLSSLEL